MCSIVGRTDGNRGSRLAALVAHARELTTEITALLADDGSGAELATVPTDALAGHATALLAVADRATAAATVLAGRVQAGDGRTTGTLIAGRYASARRWLEVDAGLSATSAKTVLARARDLHEDYPPVAAAWLAGEVSGDAVRELTLGIRTAIRHLPSGDRDTARDTAIEVVLPVARVGTVNDVHRVVRHLGLLLDPDGTTQAALDAYDAQSLTCTQVGAMSVLTAHLTHEAAAAVMTVLTHKLDTLHRSGALPAEDRLPGGVDPDSLDGRRQRRARRDHMLAVVLAETMTGLLAEHTLGSHHGVAPHVTLTVDLDRVAAGLGGDLHLPGADDPLPLPSPTIRRILCDAELTTVITTHATAERPAHADAPSCDPPLTDLLRKAAHEVLYVGRAHRTVPPRLRRALETRDGHCAFPDCRAAASRCDAHHVTEWERGGETSISNTLLLCVRHHHAVHEGAWSVTAAPGVSPGTTGHWTFTPPPRRPRP